ncbi:MAG: TraB/VirB10 family protein [Burkholderiales bacterium]|nr:TraB/VirB10 family protein [Burkholderiales bacterium]
MGLERFTNKYRNTINKKKLIIVLVVAGIIGFFMISTQKTQVPKTNDSETQGEYSQAKIFKDKKYNESKAQEIYSGDSGNQQNIWMATGQKQLEEQNQAVQQLAQQQQAQQQQSTQLQSQQQKKIDDLNLKLDQLNQTIATQQQVIASNKISASGTIVDSKVTSGSQIQEIDMDDDSDNTIGHAVVKDIRNVNDTQNVSFKQENKDIKDVSQYIPSNTFVQGNLIASISANTGGNAGGDPQPMLIRLTNLAQLPNFFRASVKNCMVGANGYGDLSTERIKIRLTNLSCVLKNGHAIDIPVKGYVAGEDGKAGIKGKVVTHQGSLLAKAALAGFLQGMGTTAQNMSQTQQVSPIGTTTSINPNQAIGYGAGAGAANAFNNLSNYYVNMLNQITPSIEVSSGRNITVVLTEGISLKEKLTNVVDTTDALPFNKYDM